MASFKRKKLSCNIKSLHCFALLHIVFFLFWPFIQQNSSSLHCFAFADADFTPKTDVVRGPASAGVKGSALTIHTLSIKGREDLVGAMLVKTWVRDILGYQMPKGTAFLVQRFYSSIQSSYGFN